MTAPVFPDELDLADYFLFARERDGSADRVALRFGARAWTYAEVAARSRALAQAFIELGLRPEQRVYVVLPDVPPFAWAIFATLAAGGVLTMGNPVAPADDLAHVLGYVRAAILVTTPEVAEQLAPRLAELPELRAVLLAPDAATGDDPEAPAPPGPRLAALVAGGRARPDAIASGGGYADAIAAGPHAHAAGGGLRVGSLAAVIAAHPGGGRALPRIRRDDPAIWLFTSGSTGRAKAAMHSHRDFAFNTEVYAKRTIGYRRDDIAISVPRLFFGYATGTNLWFPFAVGATVGLFSERPTAESVAAAIARYRPTIVTNVPTMLGKLLDLDDELRGRGEPGLDLACVRFHLSAGEALPEPLLRRFIERFGGEVYDGIGSAEMFHIYCTNRPGDVMPGSLGRAVDGYTLKILPEDAGGPGAPALPPDEIGVLWVKGDSVAHGYFQDRDKSWSTFHGHWCRTGDLFRIDAHGYLWFSGRADDLFKVGGIFVAPREVEDCLLGHACVSGAAVIPAEDAGLTKPKAVIVVRPDARDRLATPASRSALADELKAHVQARLSKHKYPRWVVFVDELPKNDRGKVDKKLLIERERRGELDQDDEAPEPEPQRSDP